MSVPYEKSWKHFAFKERNDKIRRLWEEGMEIEMICKRFGLSGGQVRTVLKQGHDRRSLSKDELTGRENAKVY